MKANEIFNIKLNIQEELSIFTGRVLFWWEEQNIKLDSVYEESTSSKLMIEHSKVFNKTVNKFLIIVESNNKKVTKDDLYIKSIEKNKNVEWSDILHHSVVIPLYEAYIGVSGSSMTKMQEFRKKVIAAYDKTMRMEGFDDFPLPPELIEYDLLSTNGVLTRNDLLSMSYAEILKYQTIREIDSRYKKNNIQNNSSYNPLINPPNRTDMQPEGQFNFFNPEQAAQAAKQFFPDVVV